MAYLTKKQERERFIDEFLQRLREAPPGTRVYMRVGDVFRDADVVSIDELRAAREAALVRDHDDNEGGRHVPVKCARSPVRRCSRSRGLPIWG
jgi:hypothetical protein